MANENLRAALQMADSTARQVTGSYRTWTDFLATSGRLYILRMEKMKKSRSFFIQKCGRDWSGSCLPDWRTLFGCYTHGERGPIHGGGRRTTTGLRTVVRDWTTSLCLAKCFLLCEALSFTKILTVRIIARSL